MSDTSEKSDSWCKGWETGFDEGKNEGWQKGYTDTLEMIRDGRLQGVVPSHNEAIRIGYGQAVMDVESGVVTVRVPPSADRRFQAAVAAMAAIIAARADGLAMPEWEPETDAGAAVEHADALLAALEESK